MAAPKNPDMDDAHNKTREIVSAVQIMQATLDEADQRTRKEIKALDHARDKLKTLEFKHAEKSEALDKESKEHSIAKSRLEEELLKGAKTEQNLDALMHDNSVTRLENDALKAEIELNRKNFLISESWKDRHAELKAKFVALEAERDSTMKQMEDFGQQLAIKSAENEEFSIKVARLERMCGAAAEGADAFRQRAIATLQKSFGSSDHDLVLELYEWWSGMKKRRVKAESSKEAAMASAVRSIANNDSALVMQCYSFWSQHTNKEKASGARKDASMARATRMISDNDGALTALIMQAWCGDMGQTSAQREKKRENMQKAAQLISSNDKAIAALCYHGWEKAFKSDKDSSKRKEQNKAHALRSIAGDTNMLMAQSVNEWQRLAGNAKKLKASKEEGTAKALRMISSSDGMIVASFFNMWEVLWKKDRERNKKIKAIEKTLGMAGQGLSLLIFTEWHRGGADAKRTKNKKAHNEATGEKIIQSAETTVILQIFLIWALDITSCKCARTLESFNGMQAELTGSKEGGEKLHNENKQLCLVLEELWAQYKTMKTKQVSTESRLEDTTLSLSEREVELEESRQKARSIAEELAKVNTFLIQKAQSRHPPRPRSGHGREREKREEPLPAINSARGDSGARSPPSVPSRPGSGQRRRTGDSEAGTPKAMDAWAQTQPMTPADL